MHHHVHHHHVHHHHAHHHTAATHAASWWWVIVTVACTCIWIWLLADDDSRTGTRLTSWHYSWDSIHHYCSSLLTWLHWCSTHRSLRNWLTISVILDWLLHLRDWLTVCIILDWLLHLRDWLTISIILYWHCWVHGRVHWRLALNWWWCHQRLRLGRHLRHRLSLLSGLLLPLLHLLILLLLLLLVFCPRVICWRLHWNTNVQKLDQVCTLRAVLHTDTNTCHIRL